jgi:hypothetical protein
VREALRVERELRRLAPYVSDELFYDSRVHDISRNRLKIGVNAHLARRNALDVAYVRQDDAKPDRAHVNAIGVVLTIRLK